MCMVPGKCMPLGWQTTEGGPGRTWQAWGVSFCYLGDMLSAAGGCELSTTTCVKNTLKKLKHLSFKTRGHVYSSCVRSAMLHASKSWPLTKPNLQGLQWNDRAMIRQICNVRPQDIVTTRSNELLVWLGIRIWTSFWRREDSDGMDMWNAPVVQSRQPLTYRLMEVWAWEAQDNMEAADREGLQRVEALGYQP